MQLLELRNCPLLVDKLCIFKHEFAHHWELVIIILDNIRDKHPEPLVFVGVVTFNVLTIN